MYYNPFRQSHLCAQQNAGAKHLGLDGVLASWKVGLLLRQFHCFSTHLCSGEPASNSSSFLGSEVKRKVFLSGERLAQVLKLVLADYCENLSDGQSHNFNL